MVLAAEYTAATLAGWMALTFVVGLVIGWLLRPWLVGERLREDYENRLREERSERSDAEAQVDATTTSLDEIKAELDAVRGEGARLRADLAASRERVADLEAQVASLAVEKDAEISRLSTEASKVSSLEVAVGERDARIGILEAEAAEREVEKARAKAVAEAAEAARARLQGNEATLAAVRQRAEQAEAALAHAQAQRVAADARIAGSEARIAELEAEISHVTDTTVSPQKAVESQPPLRTPVSDPRAAAAGSSGGRDDTAVAPTLDERVTASITTEEVAPSTRDDDLTEIRGIGPAIERKLKGMGITSFRQIAHLTTEQKADIGAALGSFSDRIDRDDWTGSAARLHAEKYGVSPGA